MKKLLLISCCLTLCFLSCEKDDDNKESATTTQTAKETYYVQYKGVKYEIDKAFCAPGFFTFENMSSFSLCVASSSVSYSSWLGCITGTGNGMKFEITSSGDEMTLAAKTYTFTEGDEVGANQIYEGSVVTSYDFFMNDGTSRNLNNGSLKVSKNGDTYTLNYQGTDSEGLDIICYYKGTIKSIPSQY